MMKLTPLRPLWVAVLFWLLLVALGVLFWILVPGLLRK